MKRLLSLLMSITIICGMVPIGTYAEGNESGSKNEIQVSKDAKLAVELPSVNASLTSAGAISIVLDEGIEDAWLNDKAETVRISGKVLNFDPTKLKMDIVFNGENQWADVSSEGNFKFDLERYAALNSLSLEYEQIFYNFKDIMYQPVGATITRKLTPDYTKVDKHLYLCLEDVLFNKIQVGTIVKLYNDSDPSIPETLVDTYLIDSDILNNGYIQFVENSVNVHNKYTVKTYSEDGLKLLGTYSVLVPTQFGVDPKFSDSMYIFSPSRHVTSAMLKFENSEQLDVSKYLSNDILKLPYSLFPTGKVNYEILYSNEITHENWSEHWEDIIAKDKPTSPLIATFDPQCNLENLTTKVVTLTGALSSPQNGVTNAQFNINGVAQTISVDSNGRFEASVIFEDGYNVLSIQYGNNKMTRPVFCNMEVGGAFYTEPNSTHDTLQNSVYMAMSGSVNDQVKDGMTVKIYANSANLTYGRPYRELLGEYPLKKPAQMYSADTLMKVQDIEVNNPYMGYTFELLSSDKVVLNSYQIKPSTVLLRDYKEPDYFYLVVPYFNVDKLMVRIGTGAEIDVTASNTNGVIKLNRDMLAVGSNVITVNLTSGDKTYSNYFHLKKDAPITINIELDRESEASWENPKLEKFTISGRVINFDSSFEKMEIIFNNEKLVIDLDDAGKFNFEVPVKSGINNMTLKYMNSEKVLKKVTHIALGGIITRLIQPDRTKLLSASYLYIDDPLFIKAKPGSIVKLYSFVLGDEKNDVLEGSYSMDLINPEKRFIAMNTDPQNLAKNYYAVLFSDVGKQLGFYSVEIDSQILFSFDKSDTVYISSPLNHATNAFLKIKDGLQLDITKYLNNNLLKLPYSLFPKGEFSFVIDYYNALTKVSWTDKWTATFIENRPKTPLTVTFDSTCNLDNLKEQQVNLKGILSPTQDVEAVAQIRINGVVQQTVSIAKNGGFEANVKFDKGFNVLSIVYGNNKMSQSVFCNMEIGGIFYTEPRSTLDSLQNSVYMATVEAIQNQVKDGMSVKIYGNSASLSSGKPYRDLLGEYKLQKPAEMYIADTLIKAQDIEANNPYFGYTFEILSRDKVVLNSYQIKPSTVFLRDYKEPDYFYLVVPYLKADKIIVKIGNGTEVDMTASNINGIIKLNRNVLAVGSNLVSVTLTSGEKTYSNAFTLKKDAPVAPVTPVTPPSNGGSSSGGGGGGYSGGGGGYSAPSAPASSAAPVAVVVPVQPTNTPPALSKITTEKIDGKQVAKAKLDEAAVRTMLNMPNDKTKNPIILIPMDSTVDRMTSEFDGKMVQDMGDKKAIIQIKSDKASYSIPLSEISLSSMANKLMLMTPGSGAIAPETIKVNIEVGNAPELAQKAVEKLKLEKGVTVLAQPIEFSIKGSYGDKFVEISEFSTFVERRLAFEGSVAPGETITGVVLEKDGSIRAVPTKIIEENGKKYAVISSMTNSSYSVIKVDSTFSDISKHWAKESIQAMRSRMIMNGIAQQFNPDKNITRGDLAMAIVKSLGLGKTEGATLQDLRGDTRAGYIQTAIRYGLVSGYEDYTFRPNNNVSREEAMSMIIKAAKLCGIDVDSLKDVSTYQDTAKISAWAKPAVDKCTQLGLIKGFNGKFEAKNNLTQAEIATILLKLLQKSNLI